MSRLVFRLPFCSVCSLLFPLLALPLLALPLLALIVAAGPFTSAFAGLDFPQIPDRDMTPGSLCQTPSEYRYPERIAYCDRAVKSDLKEAVIQRYDTQLGYRIRQMNRQEFKIDHYIPLCMGGSNSADNLWPQHESVFRYTDDIEFIACQKMADGLLKQAEAIRLIRKAKADPEGAFRILNTIQAL